jgi:hypothetical protein
MVLKWRKTMQIRRKSSLTGVYRTREVKVQPKDYEMWEKGYVSIHDAMPYLDENDRSFIIAGITDDEWKKAFAAEISNIVNDSF